ncbi:MAG TPA: hypothetical protein VG652_07250 [Gaiellaceae bacterium]|nr:hypothetical protein [Gaiellaceae bacterium]
MNEVKEAGNVHDVVRRKYLTQLSRITGRNTIVYYSGWLQKSGIQAIPRTEFLLNETDKNGFMAAVHRLDRTKGLDLCLHTPGGSIAATESLVQYLRAMFGTNIRAIVPQIALSAGTMIALSCKEVVMGQHSSLGPIDPQIGGVPAHGIIEEFERARVEIGQSLNNVPLWQPIIAKYNPTLVGEAQKAVDWSSQIVKEWLVTGMFEGDGDANAKAEAIIAELADHALTKSHDRHISLDRAEELGIRVVPLEADNKLQDAVLSVHHACIQSLTGTPAIKIIENQKGVAHVTTLGAVVVGAA